jgi:G:T-mismatch repair DNA endonuclease (very short patch repair protein)
MGTVQRLEKSLSTWGVFGTGLNVCPIDISPSATLKKLLSRYEETKARLQKIRDAGYTVVLIWGCEFKKLLCDKPGLQNELCSHPYVKHSPINIRDALYGGRTAATKTY